MSDPLAGLPVYLINLPRAVDRRAAMEQRLAAVGLNYTLVPGVDGKAEEARLLASVDVPAFRRNMGREVLIGGIGCYHSHLKVWEMFLAHGGPHALVLEDDVVFHDDILAALRLALRAQAHWDLLKLNRIRAKLPVPQGRIGPYRLMAYLGPNTGTGAYLINRATAARLLPAMARVTRATDHEIGRFFRHDFRLRGMEPWPCGIDASHESLITGPGGYGGVRKFRWYRRLPNYGLRAGNYLRRLEWLAKRAEIWPRRSQLPIMPEARE